MNIIKTVFKPLCAALSAVYLFISAVPGLFAGTGKAVFTVDASALGDELPNVADNVNVWDMGTQFYNAENNTDNDIFEFVRYVQLMQCTGGTPERDLFKDPYDTSVLDDYDFSRLIENCRFRINVPQLEGKTVTVTEHLVNDDCNFFDEWCADRVKYNITDDCFSWSPDDPVLESKTTLSAEWARELYFIRLRDGYAECARLTPVTRTAEVKDGVLDLEYTLGASNVLFLEIK